jgi:hypothetical protein
VVPSGRRRTGAVLPHCSRPARASSPGLDQPTAAASTPTAIVKLHHSASTTSATMTRGGKSVASTGMASMALAPENETTARSDVINELMTSQAPSLRRWRWRPQRVRWRRDAAPRKCRTEECVFPAAHKRGKWVVARLGERREVHGEHAVTIAEEHVRAETISDADDLTEPTAELLGNISGASRRFLDEHEHDRRQ